ncbi:MAG: cyclic pyranopterin monophosphate synthase MoaC [Nisaea sp.]|jgi:cyclic pyranopterin phosphate synthase|nr:cyclic pyranopterin monophosphate synthase MoaC [Nisaea sp.]MEC9101614.1 cyclic pyranopterin monophosphate synthase MoaC [Pseudomonadota bacterium]|tara:strand:+ start:248 stop:724 length:477 start_codon:yes stop_codon:yes gene_type:complete
MSNFNHFDQDGNAIMVDISRKEITERVAVASCDVLVRAETMALILKGNIKKGDVLSVARLAGILGAKKTPDLIPLCHPLALSSAEIDLRCDEKQNIIEITSRCKINGRTGVEMEALTAVSVAALTIYDMCKAVDRGIKITNIRLLEKVGGKSGQWREQ